MSAQPANDQAVKMEKPQPRYLLGASLIIIGAIVNYLGDVLLGVHFELFYGISDFNFWWIADVFLLPAVIGFLIAVIYGFGGKWVAIFVPLLSHFAAYIYFGHLADINQLPVLEDPRGISPPVYPSLQPMGWWFFFVIVAMETAMIGAVFGEAKIKKTYGRRARHLVFKSKT